MVGSAVFSRVDSDDSLACWTSIIDVQGVGDSRPVSLVIEPATVPESAVCELAATVMARFGEFAKSPPITCVNSCVGHSSASATPNSWSWTPRRHCSANLRR